MRNNGNGGVQLNKGNEWDGNERQNMDDFRGRNKGNDWNGTPRQDMDSFRDNLLGSKQEEGLER